MMKSFFLVFFILIAPLAIADYLVRIDGEKIEGQVISKTNELIVFKGTDAITYYFKPSEVASIIMVEQKDIDNATIPEEKTIIPGEKTGNKSTQCSKITGSCKSTNAQKQKTIITNSVEEPCCLDEKISLDVREMDIKDLFLSLAELGNFNIIIDQSIQGKVTMKLNNVPIDQVIDLVCRQNKIGNENIIIVRNPSTTKHSK